MDNWPAGERIVCVNGNFDKRRDCDPHFHEIFHNLPIEDKTYTVRLCESGRVLLKEIVNPDCPFDLIGVEHWTEPGFDQLRFKTLEELFAPKKEIEKISRTNKGVEKIEEEFLVPTVAQ